MRIPNRQHQRCHAGLSRPGTSRDGLTLFEVVLSLAIFLGALSAISQLTSTGMRAALQSRLQTQAVLRCESKLAELLAGVEEMENAEDVPFRDHPNWAWSVDVADGPLDNLLALTVSVSHTANNGRTTTSFTLKRLVQDPKLLSNVAADHDAEVRQ